MALLTLIAGVALLVLLSFIFLLCYQSWKHTKYFKDRGVAYIGVGLSRLIRFMSGRITISEAEDNIYSQAKSTKSPFVGFSNNFVVPSYYIIDLEICKQIYVKDFDHFVNRRTFATQKSDLLLRKMLVGLESDRWRGLRSKLSPAFTTGKIRRMFSIFDKSSKQMCDYLEKAVGGKRGDFDICEAYSKYAMDVIANCAFGIDSKSFDYEPGKMSEFEEMGNRFQFRFKPLVFMKFLLILAAPKLADALGIQAFDTEPQNYFLRVIKDVMRHRRETGERYDDFLQLMMDTQDGLLKSEENAKETLEVMTGTEGGEEGEESTKKHFVEAGGASFKFDDEDIVANCVLFLIGGYDTTQSLLIFAAYQMALEQECQEKLRQEVREAMEANNRKLTYEAIHGMSYLDNVINETLRYFPPASRTERKCTKEYKIPGTDVVIEKGTIVCLPVGPLHHDPDYYENPEKFDPDRFLPENKTKRHPYSFAPFGHGPRNCIGMRFALTEVKLMIATLIHDYKLEPCAKTDIPVKFANNSSLKPLNGMWLNFQSLRDGSEE